MDDVGYAALVLFCILAVQLCSPLLISPGHELLPDPHASPLLGETADVQKSFETWRDKRLLTSEDPTADQGCFQGKS